MTVREALIMGTRRLAGHVCPGADAGRDAELLLAYATGRTKERVAMEPEHRLSLLERFRYVRLIARRKAHAPMAYLTGWSWFHGRRFRIRRGMLIPRPATETIVGVALAATPDGATFIDVGTGSGCIAVTAAAERPDVRVFATDLSGRALRVAERNARLHGMDGRAVFRKDDLLTRTRKDIPADTPAVIVANLPYLPDRQKDTLSPDVVMNEPSLALFGGPDGLDPARRLIDQIALWKDRPRLDLWLELLEGQVGPAAEYARKKIPGLSAGQVTNVSGIRIGIRFTVR